MNNELKKYIESVPAVADAAALRETFWLNEKKRPEKNWNITEVCPEQIKDASDRLKRFAPYLKTVFPELEKTDGIIESELREIGHMKEFLNLEYHAGIEGKLMLKMDSDLPVSGFERDHHADFAHSLNLAKHFRSLFFQITRVFLQDIVLRQTARLSGICL